MTTVVSPGYGVTISTDGVQTGALLSQINTELAAASVTTVQWDGSGSIPTVPAGQTEAIVYVGGTVGSAISLPATFEGILIATGATSVTGGGPGMEVVLGDNTTASVGSYSGGAGTVIATASENITDTLTGAVVAVANGSSVDASGANATVAADGSGNTVSATGADAVVSIGGTQGGGVSNALEDSVAGNVITVSGANDTVALTTGDNTLYATGSLDDVLVSGGSNIIQLESTGSASFDGGSSTVVTAGEGDTLYGGSGDALVYANGGNDLYVGGSDTAASLAFVVGSGTDTIVGGAEADTIYAASGQEYVGGTGSLWFAGIAGSSTVVSGSGAETLYSAGSASNLIYGGSGTLQFIDYESSAVSTVFGGSGAESLFGVSSSDAFVGGTGRESAWLYGGSDTFIGGSSAATIYAVANGTNAVGASTQNISLVGTAAGTTVNDWNVSETTINAAASGGSDTFYINALAGSASIIGSSAGNDTVWLVNDAAAARTINISNWQSSDAVDLYGYSAADQASLTAAIGSDAASVKLSDNTTINFITKT